VGALALAVIALAAVGGGGAERVSRAVPAGAKTRIDVRPRVAGQRTDVVVSLRTPEAIGRFGRMRRMLSACSIGCVYGNHQPRGRFGPAAGRRRDLGCFTQREAYADDAPGGARVRLRLLVRGGGKGTFWCRGRYRGEVRLFEGFACPSRGRCRPPRGFPRRVVLVGRFSFRVR